MEEESESFDGVDLTDLMDQVEEIKVKEEAEQENNIKGQHHNGFRYYEI